MFLQVHNILNECCAEITKVSSRFERPEQHVVQHVVAATALTQPLIKVMDSISTR